MIDGKAVYIAGPMSGCYEWNAPEFKRCEEYLRSMGASGVFNPATQERIDAYERGEITREALMLEDLRALLDSDAVVLLPGWRESFGARCEANMAIHAGKDVYLYGELTDRDIPFVSASLLEVSIVMLDKSTVKRSL